VSDDPTVSRDEFWELIDRSLRGNESDPDAQATTLEELLKALPGDEILSFADLFSELHHRADRWDIRAVGYLLEDGIGDDAFDYFRSWLIGRGERMFEMALAEPDALADEPLTNCPSRSGELLDYVAARAYEAKIGSPMPIPAPTTNTYYDTPGGSPRGRRWTPEELPQLLPRLWARTGPD
jgi:hypothetical protein